MAHFFNTTAWNRIRYSFYAPFYDLIGRALQPQRRRAIELLHLRPGERVLILGAGTGLDLEFLPAGVDITATDLAAPMVRRIRSRAARLRLSVNARIMDGERLEFADASFDVVVLHLILAVIPDPLACIREAARVLKPDGKISIFDKFLPEGQTPSRLRRMLDPLVALLASEINRPLGPILQAGDLEAVHDEPALLNGMFRIIIARKCG